MPYVSCDWCGEKCYKTPSSMAKFAHKFCSKACQYAWQNRHHKPNTVCDQCGKTFYKKPASIKRRPGQHHFCSLDCRIEFQRRNQIARTCEVCGTQFFVPQSRLKYGPARFCSPRCAGTEVEWVVVICQQCHKAFKVPPAQQDTARFCSRECRYKSQQDSVELICQQCGTSYSVYRSRADVSKFCSLDCRIAYYQEHESPLKDRVLIYCDWCGQEYEVVPSKVENTRFCSLDCRNAAFSEERSGPDNWLWQGGPIDTYGSNWLYQRKLVLERDTACRVCGASESQNGHSLDVHHVIPIREFEGDWHKANQPSNLIALCRSCHAKVECGEIDCPTP